MNRTDHEEFESLLGAYVLDAVEPLEYRRITKHLATCTSCAREVALLQGPAVELGLLPGAETDADELVDRITAALPWRPRRAMTRVAAGIAAVSILVAGFLGASLIRARNDQQRLVNVLAQADETFELRAQPGFAGAGKLFVSDEGETALVLEEIPEPGTGKSYQLWALKGSKPTSMAVLNGDDRIVEVIDWKGEADVFAVTIEPSGGSPVPTTDPVLVTS